MPRHVSLPSAALLASVLASFGPALAAEGPWTPAPVPSVGPQRVMPAARTGPDFSPATVDTPFSAVPEGSVAANGATSSNVVNGVQTPDTSGK